MTDFEFVFALFGLLLGLSLIEVLGGLARVIEARTQPGATLRVGWLTPLMAGFVLLDLLSFWAAAWRRRDAVLVSGHSLLAVTAFASAYYLAASLTFPRDLTGQRSLDDHFFRVRRVVIGTMLALLACQMGWYLSLPPVRAQMLTAYTGGMTLLLAGLMVAALAVRGERAARLVMAALVARYLVGYLL